MSSKILLKGGTLLTHDVDNHVKPTVSDLLIEGSKIAKIQLEIEAPSDAKLVDCTNKIISPGFVSTHAHLYQSQMKGRHANDTLIEYMPKGNYSASLYTVEDAFWGQLAGALEFIDAGTTTVVDHSSLNLSPDYPKTMVQALVSSGLRCVYCSQPPRYVHSWSPFKTSDDIDSPWVMESYKTLARGGPYGNGRVLIGFANDNVFMPAEGIKSFYASIREAGAQLITTHAVWGPAFGSPMSVIQILESHGLLAPDILASHANFPAEGDADKLRKSGATVTTTPNTELQMGWPPIALRTEFEPNCSIGTDCHSWGVTSHPEQMRMLLQYARTERSKELASQDKWSRHTGYTTEQVFNLGTISGAKAIGMSDRLGKLAVGMEADLVIFDATSPSMIAAAEEDPLAAVVLHSSQRDVDMVIIDGVIRKENGQLVHVKVADALTGHEAPVESGRSLSWKDVAASLMKSRKRLVEEISKVDTHAAEDVIMDLFYMRKDRMIEKD